MTRSGAQKENGKTFEFQFGDLSINTLPISGVMNIFDTKMRFLHPPLATYERVNCFNSTAPKHHHHQPHMTFTKLKDSKHHTHIQQLSIILILMDWCITKIIIIASRVAVEIRLMVCNSRWEWHIRAVRNMNGVRFISLRMQTVVKLSIHTPRLLCGTISHDWRGYAVYERTVNYLSFSIAYKLELRVWARWTECTLRRNMVIKVLQNHIEINEIINNVM